MSYKNGKVYLISFSVHVYVVVACGKQFKRDHNHPQIEIYIIKT